MNWYLETWRTPYWRRVLATLCGAFGLLAWALAADEARGQSGGGEPWPAVIAPAVPGVVAWILLFAAATWLAAAALAAGVWTVTGS